MPSKQPPPLSVIERAKSAMIVYLLKNTITHKCYVGQSRVSLERRFRQHIAVSRCPKKRRNSAIGQAIHKYGPDVFERFVLMECDTQEQADEAERLLINAHGTLSPGGYNLRTGGGPGWIPSDQTRAKMSAAKKGITRSAESIRRQSDATKGIPKSQEHRAAISAALKGRPLAWAQKIADSRRRNGTRPSERQRAALMAGRKVAEKLRSLGVVHNRGDKCANAKLTWDKVREIRRLYATGGFYQKELGVMFGVDTTAIGYITRNETWKEDCAPQVSRIHSRLSKEQRIVLVSGR